MSVTGFTLVDLLDGSVVGEDVVGLDDEVGLDVEAVPPAFGALGSCGVLIAVLTMERIFAKSGL